MDPMQIQRNMIRVGNTPLVPRSIPSQNTAAENPGEDFKSLLQQKLQAQGAKIEFSKHAMQRIDERQIPITAQLVSDLTGAVSDAEKKGIKNALILRDQTAFIVNIASRTVVTTMEHSNMQNNVITNIDGAVII